MNLLIKSQMLCQLSYGRINVSEYCLAHLEPLRLRRNALPVELWAQQMSVTKISKGAGIRTLDPRLKRPLLYHLSYTLVIFKGLNIIIFSIEVNKKIDFFAKAKILTD